MTPQPSPPEGRPVAVPPSEAARLLRAEVAGVLLVSFLISGLDALLTFIRAEVTVSGGIGSTTATVVYGVRTSHPWLDLADELVGLLHGFGPPILALALLARNPGGRGFGVGFETRRLGTRIMQGVGFFALIGIPGLGLVWLAHLLHVNASIAVVNFPDVWYRVPYLLLSAFQNGLAEEIVVVAYLLTRLRQLGWRDPGALGAAAVLRGSYHLYQGIGGFAGNFVMGLIFGYWFQRTRSVVPLVVAHFLLDAASFVGYLYLKSHISWI